MKFWLLLVAAPLQAHMMSMSTGDLAITGNRAEYILRMPMFEIAHTQHPETSLLDHVRFAGAHTQHQKCFQDGESYVCAADYLFDAPVDSLDVACTLYAVTVPNHVHVLRAIRNGKPDQAFFDYTFTNTTLRFRPPTIFETVARQISEGAFRAIGGLVQLLFLITLALAARSRTELAKLIAAFTAGLIAGALLNWHPAPRFAECAAALSVAYLAVETLFLPNGGMRWLIAGALGVFQGIYLALFLSGTTYFLTGAALADATLCTLLGLLLLGRLPKWAASIPLLAGLFWFFLRLRG
jgi:hypothetical protein